MRKKTLQTIILITLATGEWFALIAQFILLMQTKSAPRGELIIRFFSYFTLLSNLLIAVSSTTILFFPNRRPGRWFLKPQVATALSVYIIIVGLVYNIVLRPLWDPKGLQKTVDELLHTLLPILFILYWTWFVPKKELQYSSFPGMLVFPIVYIIYTMVRGAATDFYPYPFLDVTQQGWPATLVSIVLLSAFFIGLSLLMIFIGKKIARS